MTFKGFGKRSQKINYNIDDISTLVDSMESLELKDGQSDILKKYNDLTDTKDIAIELPTGYGKTLIGALIGDFHRKKDKDKVVYCCATRQLAAQTKELIDTYNIDSVLLTGKVSDFNQSDKSKYEKSKAIAITTYSHIFNTNPYFSTSDLIIFDDAHAVDYAIKGYWNIEINRDEHAELFDSLYSIINYGLNENIRYTVENNIKNIDDKIIDIVPQKVWLSNEIQIRNSFDSYISNLDMKKNENSNLSYSWQVLKKILNVTNMFITKNKISFIPIIPPNIKIPSFAHAKRRVYLSATLMGNDFICKNFGITTLKSLTTNLSVGEKINGRRLMLFPEDIFESEELEQVIFNTIKLQPRALVLCRNTIDQKDFTDKLREKLPQYQVMNETDIENSVKQFEESENAVLVLAGRYDGLDLKNGVCRLQILYNLPFVLDHFEEFLRSRLEANDEYKYRLATKIIQGIGRTTRDEEDYSAVMFVGDNLTKELNEQSFRNLLPSNIQAELDLGDDLIDEIDSKESWFSMLHTFYNNKEERDNIEDSLASMITEKENKMSSEVTEKKVEGGKEVKFINQILENNYSGAIKTANDILENFQKGTNYRGYRAWWYYLLANVWWRKEEEEKYFEYLEEANNASINKNLFSNIMRNSKKENKYSSEEEQQMLSILREIKSFNNRNSKFIKWRNRIETWINSKSATQFEKGLQELGKCLGIESTQPKTQGAPDGIWKLGKELIVFEAKTDIEDDQGSIPLSDIRQSHTHPNWIKGEYTLNSEVNITNVLICEKKKVDNSAKHHVEGIYLISHSEIIQIYSEIKKVLDSIYGNINFRNNDELLEMLHDSLSANGLFLKDILVKLKKCKLKNTEVKY